MVDPVDVRWETDIFLARFYRKGKMVHAQRDTLSAISELCRSGDSYAAILRGEEEVIGHMTTGGVLWSYVEGL